LQVTKYCDEIRILEVTGRHSVMLYRAWQKQVLIKMEPVGSILSG